ncbi:MAG: serine/threonine-protein kinase [Gemmataceae bacterium]
MPAPTNYDPALTALTRDMLRGRVIARDRLAELVRSAPPAALADPTAFIDFLSQQGELTRFQADKLLRGQWHGLAVGPYRLLYPFARGHTGVVYLAREEGGPPVALKVLPPGLAKREPRTLTRFLREQQIGATLPPHPHLSRAYASGTAGGVSYLAMEYIEGSTVRQILAESGPLTVGQAARVFADAASGMDAAHKVGFVHRDLKPPNIVVTPAGRGVVLDFGFALRMGEPMPDDPAVLGGQGYTLGTLDYLPPEQAANAAAVGPAADVYSLGCSLYHAVTGGPPFPGGSAAEKFRRHRSEYPPPVTDANPLIPAEFARLVAWAMSKRPADRPKSAGEFAYALQHWADPVRPAPSANGSAGADLLKRVEARWLALRDAAVESGGESDSLELTAAEATGPGSDRVEGLRPDTRLPVWVVAAGAVGLGIALLVAAAVGWAVGRATVG